MDMMGLKKEILDFSNERDWDQFHSPDNVCEELADVITYCIMLADKLDVSIEDIVLDKLEKTKRKYPVEKAKGVSTKYDKL